ncbi:MAG: restriction endonuclease subunit S [Polyangia bacterium]
MDDAIEASQAVIDQIQVVKKAMMAELLTKGLPGRHKKFKQTEIGELPEEWDLRLLDEVTTKVTDGEHLSPTLSSKGHPILSAKHIREDQVVFQDYGLVAEEDFLRYRKRCDPMVGDVLIVSRGATIGRVHFLSQSAIPFCLMGSVIQVRPQPAVLDGAFLASFLVLDRSQRELVRASGSSAQQAIYLAHLKKMPVPVPTLGEQEAIAGVHHRFGNRLSAESAFLSSLQALKSALMSVLLTGEVRVRVDKDAAA